jgi:SAM-dependent methyltransferase
MLRAAQRRSATRPVALVQADAVRLPFASASFDGCCCSFCFAHFFRPRKVLREMARVLRPGGVLAIVDVVATRPAQCAQVNRLERAREKCYTRVLQFRSLLRLFSGLPLECITARLLARPISFRPWISASILEPGTAGFLRARRAFERAVAEQARGAKRPGSIDPRHYSYFAAQLLLRRS